MDTDIISITRIQTKILKVLFFFFFFRMLAQSYTPNIYTPTPIPLLYNPLTIVLHKSLEPTIRFELRTHLPIE